MTVTGRKILLSAVALGMVAAAPPAGAVVFAVSPQPGQRTVALGSPASVSVAWRVERQFSAGGVPAGDTVSSAAGAFHAGSATGPLLGTVPRLLSQTRPVSGALTVFTFREAVTVPARVIHRAHRLGFSQVVYVRTFDDGFGAATGTVTLPVTGSGGAAFSVARVALSFADGSVLQVVEPGAPLAVQARLTVTGSGLLRAVWEVADPASTAGRPVYRVVRTVRRHLTGTGVQALPGPPLPTGARGGYRVRLRITQPRPGFEPPELAYFVSGGRGGALRSLPLVRPAPGVTLGPETRFAWRAVPGAAAYRLDLLDATRQGARPVTGVVVPGERSEAVLSAATRGHLVPGRRYRWRVRAIDGQGRMVAESEIRELRVP